MNISILIVAVLVIFALLTIIIVLLSRLDQQSPKQAQTVIPIDKGESSSVRYLKDRCKTLEQRDVERKLYIEVTKVLSTSSSFDDLTRNTVDVICTQLHASHGALMWICPDVEMLEFRYARGYGDVSTTRVPIHASLAGSALLKTEPVFLCDPRQHIQYVPIGTIYETNLLLCPVRMFKNYRGVLRISNIDPSLIGDTVGAVFAQLSPILSSILEKTLLAQENERRKNELLAISGVTQALNRTLDVKEICAACARHLKPIFNYSYFMVVRNTSDENLSPLVAIPREIRFNESEASSRIILRNLCARREPLLIEDVRRADLVKCQNKEIGALIVMPVMISNQHFGSIVLAASAVGSLDTDAMNILATLSEHLAVTIERAAYFQKQEEDASRDALTGLLNHRSFQSRLRSELQRCVRYKRPCSLVMIDIDHFKKFNDTHGHQTGDLVLRAVAEMLRRWIRTTDLAFRYGGEELVLLLPETLLDPASVFAARLCSQIAAQRINGPTGPLQVTVSMGVAQTSVSSMEPEAIIKAADKALYLAKESGRNRVCTSRESV